MKMRNLDGNGDWTFGQSLQNYATQNNAIALNLKTRLYCFLNDCFFDADGWIDWFNLLGSKNEASLLFSIKSLILQTPGVNSVDVVSSVLDEDRALNVSYNVKTIYGTSFSGFIGMPLTPFARIGKYVGNIIFTGQESVDIDVSASIGDALEAIWILYDADDGFSVVVGAVQPLNQTSVRITMIPARSGNFRLIGMA